MPAQDSVVVVESPTKAKTIEKFLGKGFKVIASFGHVRDLPKSKLGVDVENNFEPQYIIPKGSAKQMNLLKRELEKAKFIYLATDYDREGEAIAWHILQAVAPQKNQTVGRITFTEITESAIQEAIKKPREIDIDLVDAQQARRILDRLVGYSLSPLLWKKVRRGLSAGRVQSVAVKLIVEREREIQAFEAVEYWSIDAELETEAKERFSASLKKISGKKAELGSEAEAQKIADAIRLAKLQVTSVDTKEVKRSPAPPFITSTLQQEASRKLGYSSKKTMVVAQQLYEGIDAGSGNVGLITYMRTDSYNLSAQAVNEAHTAISKLYGPQYGFGKPRVYKKKVRGAQEAHEAIRPSSFLRTPDKVAKYLSKDQLRLYTLIWQRALASQMADAKYEQQGADIVTGEYSLRATGRKTLFEGFTKVYLESTDDEQKEQDNQLPSLKEGQALTTVSITPEQHFTSPPPRFTEASLIKKLEENGIGRPSTYAPTISTIVARGYINVESRQLVPTEIAFLVTDLLSKHFPFVVSEDFTAQLEDKLDDIAEGQTKWQPIIKEFYEPLSHKLEHETDSIERVKPADKPTDETCEKCGKPMVIKTGRFGEFMACTGWPECKNTKAIIKSIGVPCPECDGELIAKRTKRGKVFYGCSNYPKCKHATWTKPKAEASSET